MKLSENGTEIVKDEVLTYRESLSSCRPLRTRNSMSLPWKSRRVPSYVVNLMTAVAVWLLSDFLDCRALFGIPSPVGWLVPSPRLLAATRGRRALAESRSSAYTLPDWLRCAYVY